MGRSRGGLIVAPSHIKMNKLLLALAIGLSLLALAAGSSEEENQQERFESGLAREAREANPAKGPKKNQAKKKNLAKRKNKSKKKNQAKRKNQDKRKNKKGNKKGKSNKRKELKGKKGGKGQKGKRNNKKNGMKSGKGNKNRKSKGNQNKKEKNGNKKGIRKNQNRMNTADARTTCLSTTCVDTAVAAMKLLKDKVDNFEKQEKRISKKSNIGSKKSAKKDVFGPTLQRLSDAAGGNLSAPVCAGNASSPGAAQMLNLSMTLQTCDDDIFAACDTSNLPTPNDTKVAECKAAIATFKNYTDTCTALDGAAACDCWTPSAAVTAATAEIKACDLSSNNTAVVTAVKACKAAFGKCRKYEDDVGDIIFSCEQNADTLKLKLKALSDNSDKVGQVATKVDALVNATRRNFASGRSAKAKRDASTAAGFISICTQINTWVTENPYYYQISSYATTIITVTAPVFTAADLTALSTVNTALQVSVTTLTVAVSTMQATILELTGATVSDAELDALPSCEADPDVCYPDATTVGTTATTGTTGTTTTGTTGTTTTGTTGTTSDVCVCTTAEGTTGTTPLSATTGTTGTTTTGTIGTTTTGTTGTTTT